MSHLQQTILGRSTGWTILGPPGEYSSDDSSVEENQALDRFLYSLAEEDYDDDEDTKDKEHQGRFRGFDTNDDDSDVFSQQRPKSVLALGYVCGVVAPLLRAVSAGCAQALNSSVPALQLSLMRYTAEILFVMPFICAKKLTLIAGRYDMLWLVLAAILSNVNNATYYGACVYLPVGVVGGVMATFSILWATLVTLIVSGKVKLHTAAAVILCTVGIALLVQPQFLFRNLLPAAELRTHSLCGGGRQTTPNITNRDDLGRRPFRERTADRVEDGAGYEDTSGVSGRLLDHNEYGGIGRTEAAGPGPNVTDGPRNTTDNTDGPATGSTLNNGSIFGDYSGQRELIMDEDTLRHGSLGYEITGFVLIVISSLSTVTVTVIMRYRLNDIHPFIGVLWFSIFGIVTSSLILPILQTPTFPDSPLCVVIMFTHSCSASIAAIVSMVAMMLIPPLPFYLLHSLETLFLASAQYTVLRHLKPGRRNVVEAVGIALVFISTLAGPGYSSLKRLNKDEEEMKGKNKSKQNHGKK